MILDNPKRKKENIRKVDTVDEQIGNMLIDCAYDLEEEMIKKKKCKIQKTFKSNKNKVKSRNRPSTVKKIRIKTKLSNDNIICTLPLQSNNEIKDQSNIMPNTSINNVESENCIKSRLRKTKSFPSIAKPLSTVITKNKTLKSQNNLNTLKNVQIDTYNVSDSNNGNNKICGRVDRINTRAYSAKLKAESMRARSRSPLIKKKFTESEQ